MLTRIEIDGFKTFEKFGLDIGSLQVILGANASGKSNLFDAIRFLSRIAQTDLRTATEELRGEPVELFRFQADGKPSTRMNFAVELMLAPQVTDFWGDTVKISHSRARYEVEIELRQISPGLEQLVVVREVAYPILIENDLWSAEQEISPEFRQAFLKYRHSSPWLTTVETDDKRRFQILVNGQVSRTHSATNAEATVLSSITSAEFPHLYAIHEEMRSYRFLQLDPIQLRRPSPTTAALVLEPDGSNFATVLARIQAQTATESQPKGVIADIAADLTALIPGVVDLNISLDTKNKEYQIEISMRDGVTFSSRVISDGTLRVLALLTVLHDPQHHGLICFEEPENGIHPERLKTLIQRLRQGVTDLASEEVEETEPLSQMLLNSHSPVVLSSLEEGEAMFADIVSVVNPEAGTVTRKTRIRSVGIPHQRLMVNSIAGESVSRLEVERYLHSVDSER
ncbi:AAA family ATPase [Aetokthonos hydrillicola Thurmond2011]|jgi:predicted ATPase|uniref:AAA family ATPase n=2 Tax=Aetokthonos TaxID=1550243 RepID=A0AAP5I878_9CYAN|nr:AAA family ATPase [Aetokthonos hydrillicola]MBO3458512.1 AAA family ATPase [Aetokthonos hydrillicola CCALA 1050]MBW4584956.1 AAA family ATPase [Aetokthonos hydrillicola CCALA 1050]MDR9894285.1 AAA family ATPase [Aetokthonos hydrillicola Thurmond2011]